jgi:hypothetical protein
MPLTKQEPCQFGKTLENHHLTNWNTAAQHGIRLLIVQLRHLASIIAGFCDKGAVMRRPRSCSEFVPAVIGRRRCGAAMPLKRPGQFLAERSGR